MNNKMRLRDENGKIYFGWYIIIMASLIGTLIYNGIISTSGYFMVPVTTELQIPVGAFSLYISILSVANIITLYIVSKIVNKNNIKKIMLITGTLGVLSFVGFAFSSQVWHFYALSILQGICFAACTATPCTILVSNWFGPAVRGRAMSIYIGGISLLGMVVVNILNSDGSHRRNRILRWCCRCWRTSHRGALQVSATASPRARERYSP